MKDNTTAERTGPAEPPVPPALLALFSEAEIQARGVQGEPAPLPPGPTAAQLKARRAREEDFMRAAETEGCPPYLLERGPRVVATAWEFFYKKVGHWPARGIVDRVRFRGGRPELVDRHTGDPQMRVLAIWENGRWDKTLAAQRNHHIHGDPLLGIPPVAMTPVAVVASPRERRDRQTSSPTRAGPDDDGEPHEHEPPARRFCICPCGRDTSHKRKGALYFDPEACRKRYERALDRTHPDRVVARKLKRLAAAEKLERLTAADLPAGCRCSGEGADRDPEGVWVCVSCGRPLTVDNRAVNGYDRRLAEVRGWMRNERVESRQVHRRRSRAGWRTRPTRQLAAKLRKTRKDRKVSA